jgi:thiamine pyrophosphate-dependent acetolactate synthase large subunit-like protein
LFRWFDLLPLSEEVTNRTLATEEVAVAGAGDYRRARGSPPTNAVYSAQPGAQNAAQSAATASYPSVPAVYALSAPFWVWLAGKLMEVRVAFFEAWMA